MLNNSLPHGVRISPLVSDLARKMLWHKFANNQKISFSDREISYLQAHLNAFELPEVIDGVNFSRIQIDEIVRQRRRGGAIEFEALGPYLIDYISNNGIITLDNLIPEDRIGLELARLFRKLLPSARLVSLYDDLNSVHANDGNAQTIDFSEEAKVNFKESLLELLISTDILTSNSVEGTDYLLVAESSKLKSAERMVERLDRLGHIVKKDKEIWFINEAAENLLYRKFLLRSKQGTWLCVTLDASSFLSEANKRICHLVILPDYMKQQQDTVWEILRVLGLHPLDYHNIFYDPGSNPRQITKTIRTNFQHFK